MTKPSRFDVVGARGDLRPVVEFRGHRAHRVEQHRERPVELLAAAGEDHVLLAVLDHLVGVADAVVRGRAGRGDRIVHALDLEPGRERRRGGRGHRLRHGEGADALRALAAGGVGGLDDGAGRGAARAHDDAGALVARSRPPRGRHRGSPGPWRRGSRRCRRRGSAWRGGRPASSGSRVGAPCTWQRKPSSCVVVGARRCRICASRREASTSCVLLPIDETMPMPVTTTRLMALLLVRPSSAARLADVRPTGPHLNRLERVVRRSGPGGRGLEQADAQVLRLVDASRRRPRASHRRCRATSFERKTRFRSTP